jgi:hypothetical protein
MQLAASMSGSLTKEQRDRMTPSQVVDELKKGNERFRAGKMAPRDYLAEKRSSSSGQYPAAIILGCVDSRVPAEIVFDTGIGDTFNGRVAGNVVNDDLLGSMEFACAASGAKLVLVLGHTACGAIKGAIDDVVLGNLTGLLARIKPAIPAPPGSKPILIGFRYWHLGTTLKLQPSVLGNSFYSAADWVDAVEGAKFQAMLMPKTILTIAGDAGGGGSRLDYQVVGLIGYKLKRVTLQGGWRYLVIHKQPTSGSFAELAQTGVIVGAVIPLK